MKDSGRSEKKDAGEEIDGVGEDSNEAEGENPEESDVQDYGVREFHRTSEEDERAEDEGGVGTYAREAENVEELGDEKEDPQPEQAETGYEDKVDPVKTKKTPVPQYGKKARAERIEYVIKPEAKKPVVEESDYVKKIDVKKPEAENPVAEEPEPVQETPAEEPEPVQESPAEEPEVPEKTYSDEFPAVKSPQMTSTSPNKEFALDEPRPILITYAQDMEELKSPRSQNASPVDSLRAKSPKPAPDLSQ